MLVVGNREEVNAVGIIRNFCSSTSDRPVLEDAVCVPDLILCTAPTVAEEDASHYSRVALVHLGLVRLEDETHGFSKPAHHVLAIVAGYLLVGRSAVGAILVLVHDIRAERHQPRK